LIGTRYGSAWRDVVSIGLGSDAVVMVDDIEVYEDFCAKVPLINIRLSKEIGVTCSLCCRIKTNQMPLL
jgi:hypothetical protein